ncbi:ATP-binding protein [Vibrio sp. V02_P2A34T13]|nr:AAA family ATPase [Vibrio sp. V22_P2S10T140]OXX41157.1 AAA family ATPase [Vibrio sp. V07_P2A8T137]OXX61981.1 AAA family ATPase [Vibrio sp. V10_P2A27P122]PSD41019.1 ATP-binding protein [Vibrio sp. V02_P2A34T13]
MDIRLLICWIHMALTLTLIRGLPGSGKSTLARTLHAKHFEADMYFINEKGNYCYQPDKIEQAHRWCQQQVERCLAQGEDVVVANTFVRQWEMRAYRQLAKRYHATLVINVCRAQYQNVHGIDDATVERMRQQWQE